MSIRFYTTKQEMQERDALRAAYWEREYGISAEESTVKFPRIKKDLQKTVKAIRDGGLNLFKEFPKATMTESQMTKRSATVNCGARCKGIKEQTLELAEQVMQDERFAELLKKYGMKANIELSKDGGYQIRINY